MGKHRLIPRDACIEFWMIFAHLSEQFSQKFTGRVRNARSFKILVKFWWEWGRHGRSLDVMRCHAALVIRVYRNGIFYKILQIVVCVGAHTTEESAVVRVLIRRYFFFCVAGSCGRTSKNPRIKISDRIGKKRHDEDSIQPIHDPTVPPRA